MLPFLRSAALFFHYLNSTAPPADLLGNYRNTHMQKYDANMIVVFNELMCICVCAVAGPGQWEALCSYLSLPSNLLHLYYGQHTVLEPLIERYTHPHQVT